MRLGMDALDAIVIDGRSGSGKTSLADLLIRRFAGVGRDAQVLRVEDLYPGWDGLAQGSASVADALDSGSYRRFDWTAERFGEPVHIDPKLPLIVEGCGAVTSENLRAVNDWTRRADAAPAEPRIWSVWLELPGEERRTRALARDGETFAPHWQRWADQEDRHYAAHAPWDLVNEVLRG